MTNASVILKLKVLQLRQQVSCDQSGSKRTEESILCCFFTASTLVTTSTLPSQCTSYTSNSDSTRNIATGTAGSLCDNTLTAGWYRFTGAAGTRLATSSVSLDTCTTGNGGSYNGTLPSTSGATTFGTLCVNNNGYLCYAALSGSLIVVTNCGSYYVFFLSPITNCNSRYCTTS